MPVALGGKQHFFAVDTGAGLSVFDSSLRSELVPTFRSIYVHGSDGQVEELDLFRAPNARVGGLPLDGVSQVLCIDFARFRTALGDEIYGILGLDFLRNRVVRIDFDRGEVSFLTSLPDDSGAPFVIDLSPDAPPKVRAQIAGIGEQWFMIDTGCSSAGNIERSLLARLVNDGQATPVNSAMFESMSKSRLVRNMRLHGVFALGGFRHRELIFGEGPDNVLGRDYLERYLVTFDFPEKRMYLKRSERFDKLSLYNLSGAQVWLPDGAMAIRLVAPNSPADIAGLKVDDVVEEIDGRRVASLNPQKAWGAVCHSGTHTIRVRRGEARLTITLLLGEPSENAAPPR